MVTARKAEPATRRSYHRLTPGEAHALREIVARVGGIKPAARRLGVGDTTLEAALYDGPMLAATKARLLDAMAREVTP